MWVEISSTDVRASGEQREEGTSDQKPDTGADRDLRPGVGVEDDPRPRDERQGGDTEQRPWAEQYEEDTKKAAGCGAVNGDLPEPGDHQHHQQSGELRQDQRNQLPGSAHEDEQSASKGDRSECDQQRDGPLFPAADVVVAPSPGLDAFGDIGHRHAGAQQDRQRGPRGIGSAARTVPGHDGKPDDHAHRGRAELGDSGGNPSVLPGERFRFPGGARHRRTDSGAGRLRADAVYASASSSSLVTSWTLLVAGGSRSAGDGPDADVHSGRPRRSSVASAASGSGEPRITAFDDSGSRTWRRHSLVSTRRRSNTNSALREAREAPEESTTPGQAAVRSDQSASKRRTPRRADRQSVNQGTKRGEKTASATQTPPTSAAADPTVSRAVSGWPVIATDRIEITLVPL